MPLLVRVGDFDVELLVHDPDATEADLARALGRPWPEGGGSGHPRRLADLGLLAGADLSNLPRDRALQGCDGPAGSPGERPWELVVVGGLAAGGRVALAPDRTVTVGRAADADLRIDDPTVSRRHGSVRGGTSPRWHDLGSRNGSWSVDREATERPLLDGPVGAGDRVRLGAALVEVRPAPADRPAAWPARPPGLVGRVPHNRPPRAALPLPPAPVAAPVPPPPPGEPLPLGVVTVVGPLVMAAVLVVVLGNPAFALFALLAPVLAVGNHLESKRRRRTGGRREAARWRDELAAFAAALDDAAATELARRHVWAPDLAEVVRRAVQPSTRLWERRPAHDDWLHLAVGTGTVPWSPAVVDAHHGPRPADVQTVVERAGAGLPGAPAAVDLAGGGVVGVVGPRAAALAVARALVVQATVHHGPADLAVLVAAGAQAAAVDWDWAGWLPHVEDADSGRRRLAVGRAATDELAGPLLGDPSPLTLLVVVDGDELLAGRRSPLRRLLDGRAGPVAGIVLTDRADRLPSTCSAVFELDGADGRAVLRRPSHPDPPIVCRAAGLTRATAREAAIGLARFDDPESDHGGAGLPDVVRLLPLLGLDDPLTPAAIAERWSSARADERVSVPIGVDGAEPVELDLDADGPHALVAGTTGAGKSELLRSLVAGLAATADPDHVTFLLVDFKGGAAFDACARLPHVVGLVTDLDAELAARALRCLEAELRHRERRLRDVRAADLATYRRRSEAPLPRLVVVVDEFATLRAELPEFVDALVGVAQRGRSLGVHLVLATQRPAGAVSDHLKANVDLRIALRVQDRAESVDVLDTADAAALPRSRPGRACVRFGPGEVTTVQTALVTARSGPVPRPVDVRTLSFGSGSGPVSSPQPGATDRTDLDHLVDACSAAWAATGRPRPRRPWPEPLPLRLALTDLGRHERRPGDLVAVGLADDPDHQRQWVAGWRPADGNLLLTGIGGAGTTTTLLALAHALAVDAGPGDLDLVAVDHGSGGLRVLERLPAVAAVLGAAEHERQARLFEHLRAELDRRRSGGSGPSIVVLVDGVAGLRAAFDDAAGLATLDAFTRVVADGPALGVHVILAADRAGAVPAPLAATIGQRWVHRLADPMDASAAGVPPELVAAVPTLPPGRFVDVTSGLLVQVAVPAEGWEQAFAAVPARRRGRSTLATATGALPTVVTLDDVAAADRRSNHGSTIGSAPVRLDGPRPWTVPIGLAGADLGPAVLPLYEGDHVLIAGPSRSGRTTALATIATAIRAARPDAVLVAIASRRSWLATVRDLTAVVADARAAAVAIADARGGAVVGIDAGVSPADTAGPPVFLLVDDADGVDDPDGALAELLDAGAVHVVAAGRAEVLRTQYAHWTRTVRRSRLGLLLRPHVDLDGDLLGATLPRRTTVPMAAGRGYLVVDGAASLVQVATVAGSGS